MTRESARGYGRIGALALFAASGAASAGTILVTHGDEAPASALTCTLGQAIHAANRANNPNGSFGDTPTGSTTIDPLDYSVATYVGTGTCSGASMGANTIDLLPIAGQTLTFDPAADYPDQGWNGDVADRADNYWYGPNALPPVASTILIEGSGVILEIPEGTARLRFFFVGADPAGDGPTPGYNTPGPGDLTLREITLRGGRQLGGSGGTAQSGSSGGGAGLGGAIYNQGRLRLQRSTLHGNAATGGDGSDGGVGVRGGGGGIGSDSSFNSAGGMGGAVPGGSTDAGHAGQVGPPGQGGGGGGPDVGLAGAGSGTAAGAGGNGGGGGNDFGGGGGGFGGGPGGIGGNGGDGGSFGGGGSGGLWFIGGGGGAGGGGGSPDSSSAGGGGFGGGGGGAFEAADGGFGGGVGGGHGGVAGFGGGTAFEAGGGAGMGGAIFNHSGEVALENVTLYDNQAVGGSGFFDGAGDGLGLGGAIFNLNGELRIDHATIAGNLAQQGGAIFSLGYNARTDAGSHTATVTVARSVFADNGTGGDLSNTAPEVLARDQANAATQSLAVSGSIIEDPTGATFTPGSTYISADPLLESLEDAGGPTPTLVPGIGSPAVDTVACGTSVVADQRGVPRPRGSGCDRGAVERTGIVVLAGALPPLDADEGNGGTRTLAIPLQLAPISDVPPNGPVSFDYALTPAAGSSGTVADDFVGAVTGTVSIASPDTSTEVVLTIRADETVEPDEAFVLALASPPGGADFEPAQYTITLRNDDSTSGEPGLVFRDGFED